MRRTYVWEQALYAILLAPGALLAVLADPSPRGIARVLSAVLAAWLGQRLRGADARRAEKASTVALDCDAIIARDARLSQGLSVCSAIAFATSPWAAVAAVPPLVWGVFFKQIRPAIRRLKWRLLAPPLLG